MAVPERLAREVERASPKDANAPRLFHRLSASMFDTEERRFFGRTYESAELPCPRDAYRPFDMEHDLELYFHSAQRCVESLKS